MIDRNIAYDASANDTYLSLSAQHQANLAARRLLLKERANLQAKIDELALAASAIDADLATARMIGQRIHISDLPIDVLRLIYHVFTAADQVKWSQVCKLFCKIRFEHVRHVNLRKSNLMYPLLSFINYAKECFIIIDCDCSRERRTVANHIIDKINQIIARAPHGYAFPSISIGEHQTQRNKIIAPRLQLSVYASVSFHAIDRCALQTIIDLPTSVINDLYYSNDGVPTWRFPNLRHLFTSNNFNMNVNYCRQVIVGAPQHLVCNRATLLAVLYIRIYLPNTTFVLTDYCNKLVSVCFDNNRDVNYGILNDHPRDTLFLFYRRISAYANPKYPQLRVATMSNQNIQHLLNLHVFTIVLSAKVGPSCKFIYREAFDDHCKGLLMEVTSKPNQPWHMVRNEGPYVSHFGVKLTELYAEINRNNVKMFRGPSYSMENIADMCEYCERELPCNCATISCDRCDHVANVIEYDHEFDCDTCGHCETCGGMTSGEVGIQDDDD